jgi:hypothetical protein
MAWNMSGRFMESCSCKLWCPCWLGPAEPDRGWCSGAVVIDIEQGTADGLDLSGLTAVFLGDWPKDFASGNGTARVFIDETASAEQRRVLEPILTGQQGGPWSVVGGVIAQWLPAQTARIDVRWDDRPSVTVEGIGEVQLEPLRDESGRGVEVRGAEAMAAFDLEAMELARGDGTRFAAPEMRAWESGGEGVVSTFDWSA